MIRSQRDGKGVSEVKTAGRGVSVVCRIQVLGLLECGKKHELTLTHHYTQETIEKSLLIEVYTFSLYLPQTLIMTAIY